MSAENRRRQTGSEQRVPATRRAIDGGVPPSSYAEKLRAAGFALDIPPQFRAQLPLQADRLTKITIETDRNRRILVERFSQAVRNGERFAILYADLDNLKVANSIDRAFGDEIIRAGAADVCNGIAELDLDGTEVFAFRPGKAADETIMWFFGLTEEQQAALTRKGAQLNSRTRTYADNRIQYEMSNSVTVVTSDDPLFATNLSSSRDFLARRDKKRFAWDLFRQFTQFADDKTKLTKIAKDIARLPIVDIVTSLDQTVKPERVRAMRNIITKKLGDTRVSKPLMAAALRMVEEEVRMEKMGNQAMRQHVSEIIGLDHWQNTYALGDINEVRIALLDFILHDEYEKAGFDL